MHVSVAKTSIVAAAVIALLTSCGGGSPTPATPLAFQPNQIRNVKHQTTCRCLYVTNSGDNSISVYRVGSSGNAAPSQYIYGSSTDLSSPIGVAVDSSGNIYVANYGDNSVSVYAAGATGNVMPTAIINGSNTQLYEPAGVAIDPVNGDIYVDNYAGGTSGAGSVTFYAPGSDGNVAPLGTIAGSNTGIYGNTGLTLDSSGNIYVPINTNNINVYAAGSTGNVAPTQTIGGSFTNLDEPTQVALDSSLNIYAANYAAPSVTAYPAGANGNVPPSVDLSGTKTKLRGSIGVALDSHGNVYVSNYLNNTITIYSASSNGDVKPSGILKGKKTKLDEPFGIAIR